MKNARNLRKQKDVRREFLWVIALTISLAAFSGISNADDQIISNTNAAIRIWGLDNSGAPSQITGVSVEPFQGNPYTTIYADDNQGAVITGSAPDPSTANIVVYDGGFASTTSVLTYVKISGGQNTLKVAGDNVTINGVRVATTADIVAPDLSGYALKAGDTFSGLITANGGVSGNLTGNVTGNVTGNASTATTVTGAAQMAITSVGALTSLGVTGLSTLSGINNNSANITNAGAVSGVTTLNSTTITNIGTTTTGTLSVTNNASISGALTVTGATTTGTLSVTNNAGIGGALTVTGASALNGATAIHNTLDVIGATNINATGGATTNIATTNAATTNIGVLGGVNNIAGTTNINAGVNNATNINTGASASAVTIGNTSNTVNILGGTNNLQGTANINTTTLAGTLTTIGNIANTVAQQSLKINGAISSTGNATIATATGTTNTFGSGSNSINTIGNATTSANTITGLTNVVTASTTNTLTGGTGNSLTATANSNTLSANSATGSNVIQATDALGFNTITAGATNTMQVTAEGSSNNIQANAVSGSNNITANATSGSNNIEARNNNIGVANTISINTIGNTNVDTTVKSYGGAGYSAITNAVSTMGTNAAGNNTTGGMVQTNATTATIRASNSGALATNGINGTMVVGAGGGFMAYNSGQNIVTGTTVGGVVDNKSFTNKINGNLFVDGNVYINGTLDYVSSNSANTTVVGLDSGTSILSNPTHSTSAGTAIVMKGAAGNQTVVDANGKLTNVNGVASESTAALTLTNGIGNTHGLVVTETKSVLSGGVYSSSLTMDDNGATFSNANTGGPVQVHGVNDGTSDFDAVNVRQMAAGIAMAAGLAALPQMIEPDKTFALTAGTGIYKDQFSVAIGVNVRFLDHFVFKGGVATVPTYHKSDFTGNAGVAYSF